MREELVLCWMVRMYTSTLHYYLQIRHRLFLGLMMESHLYVFQSIFQSPFHSALSKIITTGYQALNLQYFFTCGHDEVRAWTIMVSWASSHCYVILHHFGSKSLFRPFLHMSLYMYVSNLSIPIFSMYPLPTTSHTPPFRLSLTPCTLPYHVGL